MLAEQGANAGGIARGTRGRNRDATHRAIGAEQDELDLSGAFAAALQHGFEPCGELLDDVEYVLLARDRLGEALLGEIGRDRGARLQRLRLPGQRAHRACRQPWAETRRRAPPRPVEEISDSVSTQP